MPRIRALTAEDRALRVRRDDGHVSEFHYIWLRDNCACPACRHPGNGQRLFDSADLPVDIRPERAATDPEGRLMVAWAPDGHQSRYQAGWLRSHCYSNAERAARRRRSGAPRRRWKANMSGGIIERIFEIYLTAGEHAYLGESVSQREHALQTAYAAARTGASSAMITAALLHDIGHILHGYDEDCAEQGIDGKHEQAAAAYLTPRFGPEVAEPVRLHVAAKRYLCATTKAYSGRLSAASQYSLELQGGPMSAEECAAFEANPHHQDALKLRIWDEAGKVKGAWTPDLEHFRPDLEAALTSY